MAFTNHASLRVYNLASEGLIRARLDLPRSSMNWPSPDFIRKGLIPEKLALFDIDGTLLIGTSVHKKGFFAALKEVYGVTVDIPWRSYSGLTDPLILRDLATKAGVPRAVIDAKLPRALEVIGDYHEQHYTEDVSKVLPGVPELLNRLPEENVLIGLVTGNVLKCAYYKLKRLGLEQHFALGGFGSDGEDRADLIKIAIARAEQQFKFKYTRRNVVYFADTQLDIQAARRAGVPVIVVRNERTVQEPFNDPPPDLLVQDMTHQEEIFEFISSL
ncbi:MAG: HAD hydrolase-like protein [Candidatus Lokiarchaeota archaeon]|nr:HAD hydrolase-like protein [Candidatus Lokiarchaeota archaeon]